MITEQKILEIEKKIKEQEDLWYKSFSMPVVEVKDKIANSNGLFAPNPDEENDKDPVTNILIIIIAAIIILLVLKNLLLI